jgi:hypothetical protein
MEKWNCHVMKNMGHLPATECYVYFMKQFHRPLIVEVVSRSTRAFENKIVFGRMVGYMNDKGR